MRRRRRNGSPDARTLYLRLERNADTLTAPGRQDFGRLVQLWTVDSRSIVEQVLREAIEATALPPSSPRASRSERFEPIGKAATAHTLPRALVNAVASIYKDTWQPSGNEAERQLMQGFFAAASKGDSGNVSVYLTDSAAGYLPTFLHDLQFDLDEQIKGPSRTRQQREKLHGGFGGAAARQRYDKAKRALKQIARRYGVPLLVNPRRRNPRVRSLL